GQLARCFRRRARHRAGFPRPSPAPGREDPATRAGAVPADVGGRTGDAGDRRLPAPHRARLVDPDRHRRAADVAVGDPEAAPRWHGRHRATGRVADRAVRTGEDRADGRGVRRRRRPALSERPDLAGGVAAGGLLLSERRDPRAERRHSLPPGLRWAAGRRVVRLRARLRTVDHHRRPLPPYRRRRPRRRRRRRRGARGGRRVVVARSGLDTRRREVRGVVMSATGLSGVHVALATPLSPDGRSVDHDGLARLVERTLHGGVRAICPVGSTGEGPRLTRAVRHDITATVRSVAGRTVPVIQAPSAPTAAEASSEVAELVQAGADAVVLAPRSYCPMTADEIGEYFHAVAEATAAPFVLYNIPAMTKVSLPAPVVASLAAHENIIG